LPASPVNGFSAIVAPSESSSSAAPKTHYVIVRDDLPKGVLAAHVLHAAGESGPAPPGSIAVALAVANEAELIRVAGRLDAHRIAYVLIREDAGPFDGQVTAIGIPPTTDRSAIRKATSDLRLVK
jgi:hypothetical protein